MSLKTRNKILGRLSEAEQTRLAPHLEDVQLSFKQIAYEPGDGPSAAYFPEQGVVSLITVVNEDEMVEAGTIGNEGMVGLALFLGADRAPDQTICQIAGSAKRMDASVVSAERERGGQLADLLLRTWFHRRFR